MKDAGTVFDEYATSYEETLSSALAISGESRGYFSQKRVEWLQRCLQEMNEAPRMVLDFGCGDGATTPVLLKTTGAAAALGLDVSPKSVELARKQYGNAVVHYELLLSFKPDEQIDVAYCNGVFHHIPPQQRAAAIRLIHNALRPGGLFAFWENNPWNPATRYVMSRCAFDRDSQMLSPPEARRLLRAGGFEMVRTDFRFIFPHVLRGLRSVEDLLFRLPLGAQYQVLCRRVA